MTLAIKWLAGGLGMLCSAFLHTPFFNIDQDFYCVRLLKPGGLFCFVVTNKWMKAGYGEPLRRLFSEKAWMRSVVDFGHAKQLFEEVDVFPSILLVEKPNETPKPKTARLCTIPREQLRIDDLSVQIERELRHGIGSTRAQRLRRRSPLYREAARRCQGENLAE